MGRVGVVADPVWTADYAQRMKKPARPSPTRMEGGGLTGQGSDGMARCYFRVTG